jgi:Arc/MetJ family transcription regulator
MLWYDLSMPRTVKARLDARDALRLEAQLAADDPDDLAEARRVRVEMDMLAAPSPKED